VIHGGRLYGGGFSGQTVNTTTYGVVTPVHGLGAVAAGSTVVAVGRTFIAGVMSVGRTKLVPWLSGPQGQEAMTTAAEVLTGQELGPGGVPPGRSGTVGESLKATAHGAERIAGAAATRGGVLSEGGVAAVREGGRVLTQADGATVRILQNASGRFNVVVEGERGIITTFENLSQKSLDRLGRNYGWR